jgi:hypothetical protein
MTNRDSKGKFTKATKIEKKSGRPSGTRLNGIPAGSSGLKQTNGYVFEEYLNELTGQQGALIFREMRDNDPVIGAMFFGLEMFIRKVKWFIDPATEDDKGQADAQFLRECKDDMSQTWSDFMAELVTMFQHGWQFSEILYKLRNGSQDEDDPNSPPGSKFNDGKYGWRKFDPRSQTSLEKWNFASPELGGGLLGMYQRPAPTYEEKYVPMPKALLFRTTSVLNNPEGRSILRNAYRPWYFKKRMEEIEGIGIERDLAGLPFAEVPAEMMREDASEADKQTLASIVDLIKNVRRDEQEGVIWPQSWDSNGNAQYKFSLMTSGGSRQFDINQVITRYDTRITGVILEDFLLLGQDQGSNASIGATTTKSALFQSALSTWLDMIQDVMNNYAVPRLFRLNGDKSGIYPRFRHEEVQKPALADLATFIAALAGAGAQLFPDVELENHFRLLAQLPLREAKNKDKSQEDILRNKTLEADIASAKETIKNPAGTPPGNILGKQPDSTLGAPTKTTGKVKSKLPPQQRRRTAAVDAAQNVQKKVRVVRKKAR